MEQLRQHTIDVLLLDLSLPDVSGLDVLKHANAAGTSQYGGVIALAGDDHGCQSSTLPHQSEQVFAAAMIPVVNPATVQEYLDFGILGYAMSRYTGCWIGFKAISETVESGASVWVDPDDKVWLTDFSANAIVRFDPLTEKFKVFASDKSGANVRQLNGRAGETWGGESGTDRLVVIQTVAPA